MTFPGWSWIRATLDVILAGASNSRSKTYWKRSRNTPKAIEIGWKLAVRARSKEARREAEPTPASGAHPSALHRDSGSGRGRPRGRDGRTSLCGAAAAPDRARNCSGGRREHGRNLGDIAASHAPRAYVAPNS